MRMYFYSNGQDKDGPITLEDLKQKDLKPKTLIWHEGLDDWKEAQNIEELREIFELSPPSLEIETNSLVSTDKQTEEEDLSQTSKTVHVKKQRMFSNPFSFDGRIRRMEYGISIIFYFVTVTILNIVIKSGEFPMLGIVYIPLLIFIWAQGAKRCHDLGNSGWHQVIPFYVFWMIFQKPQSDINEYGRNPKN